MPKVSKAGSLKRQRPVSQEVQRRDNSFQHWVIFFIFGTPGHLLTQIEGSKKHHWMESKANINRWSQLKGTIRMTNSVSQSYSQVSASLLQATHNALNSDYPPMGDSPMLACSVTKVYFHWEQHTNTIVCTLGKSLPFRVTFSARADAGVVLAAMQWCTTTSRSQSGWNNSEGELCDNEASHGDHFNPQTRRISWNLLIQIRWDK